MSTDLRVYDNEHGDPVVVMVTTGTFDVSRLVGLMEKGRSEDHDRADAILRGVRRHNGGLAALRVLKAHGGPDLLERVTGGVAASPTGAGQPYCIWCGLAVSPYRIGGKLVHDAMADSAVDEDHDVELGWRIVEKS